MSLPRSTLFKITWELAFVSKLLSLAFPLQAVQSLIQQGQYSKALLYSLRLNEMPLVHQSLESVPPKDISLVASTVPLSRLPTVLNALSQGVEKSPNLEFCLRWCQASASHKALKVCLYNCTFFTFRRSL